MASIHKIGAGNKSHPLCSHFELGTATVESVPPSVKRLCSLPPTTKISYPFDSQDTADHTLLYLDFSKYFYYYFYHDLKGGFPGGLIPGGEAPLHRAILGYTTVLL